MQANCEPNQYRRQTAKKVVVDKNEDSSKLENEQVSTHRLIQNRQLIKRYKYRDLDNNKESD